MRKYLLILLLMLAQTAYSESFYYDAPIFLKGTLVSETADSNITYDEKKHTYPAIKLSESIAILCEPTDTECQPESGINLLQLVLKPEQMKQFKKRISHLVTIHGEIFHADNGNHFTPVLLDVESIK
ncbi:MAG: DUF4431 domain-containing protein [Methylobacter sp.]